MALDIGTKVENEGKNSQGRLSAAEFNRLVDTVKILEKDVNTPASIGGLKNVSSNTDSAAIGSILVKEESEWASLSPAISVLTDYDNMLMPVYHTVLGKWVFVSVSSIMGGVTPPLVLEMVLDTGMLNVNKLG